MLAVFINMFAVLAGSIIGTIGGSKISEKYTKVIITAIGLTTFVIGIKSCIGTSDTLIIMICLILGTVIGVALKLNDRIDSAGETIKAKLSSRKISAGKFTEAFATTSVLFCVGTMTVMGSIEAGINKDYSIIIAKSVMDFISSIIYSATLGVGVFFSAFTVLIVQGLITLLAQFAAPLLTAEVINEMNAVGGAIFIGMSVNLLDISDRKIKVADMLPAIFLPIIYIPVANWISGLF